MVASVIQAPAGEPRGLALLLTDASADASLLPGVAVAAAALAAAAYGSPLIPTAYSSRALSLLPRAAAVAAPAAWWALQPSEALAEAAVVGGSYGVVEAFDEKLAILKPIFSAFHPANLLKVYGRNIFIGLLMGFNSYMAAYLEHEKLALEAEEQGHPPPAAPARPDVAPLVERGLVNATREVSVATVRRVYEHLAARRLPNKRLEVLVRDHKAWIRDALSVRLSAQAAPVGKRLGAYAAAIAHATVLHFAADCTVAVAVHTYRTVQRRDKTAQGKLVWWAKGVGLQVLRCSATWVLVSLGGAGGSLAAPGRGTNVGYIVTEVVASIVLGGVVARALAD